MIIAPELAPITHAFGFLEAPLARVHEAIVAWSRDIQRQASFSGIEKPFPEILSLLEPLGAPWFKRLWVSCRSPRWHTAYFDGSINGGDPFPPISYLSQRMGCHGLVVHASAQGRQLQLYGPETTDWLNLEWAVLATNDHPWVFQHAGPTLPFETPQAYEKRRVSERFTLEMLRSYCDALEVPAVPELFGPAAILECPVIPPGNWRFESLAEAQARLGLSRFR